jgi:hypothetical protein
VGYSLAVASVHQELANGGEAFLTAEQAKLDGLYPAIPRGAHFVFYRLPRYQYLHPGGLDIVHMHKNIGAAAIGCDKAISAISVEEFYPPIWHTHPFLTIEYSAVTKQ